MEAGLVTGTFLRARRGDNIVWALVFTDSRTSYGERVFCAGPGSTIVGNLWRLRNLGSYAACNGAESARGCLEQ